MTKTYRDWSSDQSYLFPPSPNDWIPEGDLVYFLVDTVATLDLSPIFAHYGRERRGQPPFHPRMMWTSPRMASAGLTVYPARSYSAGDMYPSDECRRTRL